MKIIVTEQLDPYTRNTSIRAMEMDMSTKSVHKILSNCKYHPFKITTVQHLHATNAEQRLEFITWVITKFEEEPNILNNVMWTDESKFTNNGIFNQHNQHSWATEDQFIIRERNYQTKICKYSNTIYFNNFLPFFLDYYSNIFILSIKSY